MIKIENFTKKYNNYIAVNNFNMLCKKGEITGIIGPNGAGKTTILKAITGRHFGVGKITIENHDINEDFSIIRNLTGFVVEQTELPGEYTVREYLLIKAELHGLKKEALKNAFTDITKKCSLEDVLNFKIKTLSKGYKERLNFAQALIYNPPVLVLDEPVTGLDPSQIIQMRKLILSLKNKHTILLSTHLMQEAESLCDRIYIINKGSLVDFGTKEEICKKNNSQTLEEAYFKLIDLGDKK